MRKRVAIAKLKSNIWPNVQLPVLEMGDDHDSIADASRILVFQAGPIRHSVLEIAEHSLVIHSAAVECRMAHLDFADAFPPMPSRHLGCRFAVSRVPDRTRCHDDS